MDRTGKLLYCPLHRIVDVCVGGLALGIYLGIFIVCHEVIRPSHRELPIRDEIRVRIVRIFENRGV